MKPALCKFSKQVVIPNPKRPRGPGLAMFDWVVHIATYSFNKQPIVPIILLDKKNIWDMINVATLR